MACRVVIAEDNVLVREGLRSVLAGDAELEVVAECASYDELLSAVEATDADVVVTDIRMPPTQTDEGIRAANLLRGTRPGTGVLVVSQHDDPHYALALLDGGTSGRGYLLKERIGRPSQLVAAVLEVARGGSVIDPRVVELLVSARAARKASPVALLTPREREVLSLMAEGKANSAIATSLVVTVRAVERHINAIFAKLGLAEETVDHRRVRAVLLYLAEGAPAPG